MVPRHQQIVERILGIEHARGLTITIGLAELLMGLWVLSGKWSRLNAIGQIIIISTMNIMEFFLARELLLWGKYNALFALLLILVIFFNEFCLNKRSTRPT